MISDYYIRNIYNLTDLDNIQTVMCSSHCILTMRGDYRDVITHIGASRFKDCKVIDIREGIENIEEELNSFEIIEESKLKISIDISLIDRKSLASIFALIAKIAIQRVCSVSVIYTLAMYTPPTGELESNNLVKPVSNFFAGWSTRPGLPIMSIVGLGYERDKAIGAISMLKVQELTYTYLNPKKINITAM